MDNWVVEMKKADFSGMAKLFGINRITARLLRNRGLIDENDIETYLHGDLTDLHNPYLMKDMDKAVKLLRQKILDNERIRIIGDYDIDGVNASYILLSALRRCGASVDTDIPDRIKDGYGINESLIMRAHEADVGVIITCDNGIAANAAVAYAKCLGMTVIVTDHHQVPYEETDGGRKYCLPEADAVIDPHRDDDTYPYKELCGAAISYKLMTALWGSYGIAEEEALPFIENVAVATVGDVVELTGENRILVKTGLAMLEHTNNLGFKSLMELCGITGRRLSTYDIGFVLGPCINAGGRLDTAKRALDLLCSLNKRDADIRAGDLKALNDSRKDMTARGFLQAVSQIEKTQLHSDKVLVVFLPECHESLAGIIAGRLRDKYSRPAFVLTRGETEVKGSGRSVEAYSMYDGLAKCGRLLTKYGGHPMAAGLSLKEADIDAFREAVNDGCTLSWKELAPKVVIDMPLPFSEITEELIDELRILEPCGKGNPQPLFALKNVSVRSLSIFGQKRNVCRMKLVDEWNTVMTGIYFGGCDDFLAYLTDKFGDSTVDALLSGKSSEMHIDITFYPSVNEYRGSRNAQVVVRNYR